MLIPGRQRRPTAGHTIAIELASLAAIVTIRMFVAILPACSLLGAPQLVEGTLLAEKIKFFTGLFGEVAPVSGLRGHTRESLLSCSARYSELKTESEQ